MRHRYLAGSCLLVTLAMSSPARATLAVGPNERIVFLGTSITAGNGHAPDTEPWYADAVTAIDAHYAADVVTTRMATATTRMATATGIPRKQNAQPVVFNAGVAGNTIAQMTARVTTDVCAHSPTIVVIEGSVNDVTTPLGTYQANTAALASALLACAPTAKYGWIGIFCDGEFFPDTSWGPTIASMEAANQSAAATLGGTYFDVRTPQQSLEQQFNTSPPGGVSGGLLTADNVHPQIPIVSPMPESGMDVYTTTFMSLVSLN